MSIPLDEPAGSYRWSGLGEDHLATGFTLHLGVHICAEEVPQEPVMVLAEDDDLRADLLRRLDDCPSGVSDLPDQVRFEPGRGEPFAGFCQMRDDVRRWGQRLAFIGRDVVERSEI